MKKKKALILAVSMAILTGCSGTGAEQVFAPSESSLYITSEGAVTSATVETYENDYYSAEELKAFAEEMLAEFNSSVGSASGENTKSAASVKECTMADGVAKLLIDFQDAETYLTFMEQYPDEESSIQLSALDVTTVSDGITKGYLVGESFTKIAGESKAVSADEVMKQSKLFVAAVEGASLIQTDGAIQYISDGVTVVGTNQVQTPADQVSYVVFK